MASFREQVDSLVGKRVRLGRGGPDERKGTLVSVQDEFLSVWSEDGSMVHYPLHHLKSVTELMGGDDSSSDASGSGWDSTGSGSGTAFPGSIRALMDSFLGMKVQVYDHGPESAAGFVFEVGDDFVKLVTGPDEMVHYPFFHIRSVRLAKPKNDNKNNSKSGSGKGGGKSGSGSGGKSGGGKSGSGSRGKSGSGSRGRSGGGRGRSGGGRSGGGKSGGGKSGGGKSGGRGGRKKSRS